MVITSFAGLRAHEDSDDFVIGEAGRCAGIFRRCGHRVPGTYQRAGHRAICGGAGGGEIRRAAEGGLERPQNRNRPARMSCDEEARAALIRENPAYGTIVCRCEGVSEGEIIEAMPSTGHWAPPRWMESSAGCVRAWGDARRASARPGPWKSCARSCGMRDGRNLQERTRFRDGNRSQIGGGRT